MYEYNLNLPDKYFGNSISAKSYASRYQIGLNIKELKNKIKQDFNISDEEYDNLIYIAAGIPMIESNFGTKVNWIRRKHEKDKYRKKYGDLGVRLAVAFDRAKRNNYNWELFKKGYALGESKGIINLKNHYIPDSYINLVLDNIAQEAIKAVYHLATLYQKAKNLGKVFFKPNDESKVIEFPIWDRVMLMYNLGDVKTDEYGTFNAIGLSQSVNQSGIPFSYPLQLRRLVDQLEFSKNGKQLTLPDRAEQVDIPLEPLNPKTGHSNKFQIPFSSFLKPKSIVVSNYVKSKIPYRNDLHKNYYNLDINTPLIAKKDLTIFGHNVAKGLQFLIIHNGGNDYTLDVWNTQYDTPELRKLLTKDLLNGTSENLNLLRTNLLKFKDLSEIITLLINDIHSDMYAKKLGWKKPLPKILLKSNQDYDKTRLKQLYIPGMAWRPDHNLDGEPAIDASTGCVTPACSRYSNQQLLTSKYPNGQIRFTNSEVGSDAWNRMTSGDNEKLLYTGFHNIPMTFGLSFTNELENTIKQNNKLAVKNFEKEFDLNQLDPNENYGVSITYYNSPNVKKAYQLRDTRNYTTNTSTHTGNVYLDPKTFDWRVVHNKGNGKVADVPMTSLIGTNNKTYGITGIYLFHREPYYLAMTPQQKLLKRELEKQLYQRRIVKNTKVKKQEESGLFSNLWDKFKDTFGLQ